MVRAEPVPPYRQVAFLAEKCRLSYRSGTDRRVAAGTRRTHLRRSRMHPGIRELKKQFEQQPTMSDVLQRFLDIVWTNRDRIPTDSQLIYRLYNGIARKETSDVLALRSGIIQHYLKPLAEMEKRVNYRAEVQRGSGPYRFKVKYSDGKEGTLGKYLDGLWFHQQFEQVMGLLNTWPDAAKVALDDYPFAFFHFRNQRASCLKLVYLHVKLPYLLQVFEPLLITLMTKVAGMTNMKVGTPYEARFDSIVIYLMDEIAVKATLT